MIKNLEMAVMSDLHLGHKRNPAERIISNLKEAFIDNTEFNKLDIIFIAGDVYDDLYTIPENHVDFIDEWIAWLIERCKKYNVLLRILEGTHSHDWGQSKRFNRIATILSATDIVKYVKDISVEYIEQLDINVLYIPDEASDTTDITYNRSIEAISNKGLSKVDFAIMHGVFEYQLPPHVHAPKHDSRKYLDIVNHLIFIGHDHNHTTFERIIAQGSFDRLTHGQEGPKGFIRASFKNDIREVKFIENKKAMIFKTIDCTTLDIDKTITKIDKKVNKLPNGSEIRIKGNSDNPIFSNMNSLVLKYPLLGWSKLIQDNEPEEIIKELSIDENEYIPITITSDNIKKLLINRIMLNSDIQSDILTVANETIDDVIQSIRN